MTQRQRLGQCLRLGFVGLLGCLGVLVFTNNTLAQSNIVPDNTLNTESSVVIPNFQELPIEAIAGGAIRGVNLFHSFQEFNVSAERGAYFFSPDAAIQNILARVTGRNPSEILGTLGTFGNSAPNFFLINPYGIIFGANASLDVGGSFVATTANAVKLGETGFFSATEPEKTNLLSVAPSALFYNAIINRSQIVNRSTARTTVLGIPLNGSSERLVNGLDVLNGQSLLLLGGYVSLEGGILQAPGGRVELGGLASSGTVELIANGNILSSNFPEAVQRASVSFNNNANVNVTSEGGGSIAINAQNLEMSQGSVLLAGIGLGRGTANSQAGDITLNATEQIKVEQGSAISWVQLALRDRKSCSSWCDWQ